MPDPIRTVQGPVGLNPLATIEPLFHHVGPLTVTTSPSFSFRKNVLVTDIRIGMTAGTTTSTIVLYKNAVSVLSVDMAAGVSEYGVIITGLSFLMNDKLAVGVTVAGTGAADAVVQLRAA